MSDDRSREFEKYNSMTTEELEEILRLDAEAPEDQESDEDLIFYIMGVLADRKHNKITGDAAQKALESFHTHYMPTTVNSEPTPRRSAVSWLRRLTAAAAVLVLLISISASVNALSLQDLWDVFAKWTKETFSFVSGGDTEFSEPKPDRKEEFTELQELLANSKRDPSIVPTWVPDGFELERIEKDISPVQEVYRALFLSDAKCITITITSYILEDPEKIEIENNLVELYEISGTQYYIFSNYEQLQAIWLNGSYQCSISGDISVDELKLMIDSIKKG